MLCSKGRRKQGSAVENDRRHRCLAQILGWIDLVEELIIDSEQSLLTAEAIDRVVSCGMAIRGRAVNFFCAARGHALMDSENLGTRNHAQPLAAPSAASVVNSTGNVF
jgi:hypothetical protein